MVQQLLDSAPQEVLTDSDTSTSPLTDGSAEALLAEIARLPDGNRRRERLRAELVEMHSRYVHGIARRYAGRGEPLEDIEQSALLGLIKAINRFDPEVGERFLPYASQVVVGEVKRHFRDRTWTVRVPRRLQELRISMREESREFTHQHGRAPTVAELAVLLDVSEEEVVDVIGATEAYQPASLDVPIADGENSTTLGDLLGADDDELESVVDREALHPILATLPERDRKILLLRFWGNKTQSQIADEFGISQMHVSRLLSRSLAYLRKELLKGS